MRHIDMRQNAAYRRAVRSLPQLAEVSRPLYSLGISGHHACWQSRAEGGRSKIECMGKEEGLSILQG